MNAIRLGNALRLVRRRRGQRQRDVADRAGVSQAMVSRLERGQVDGMTLATVEAICSVLEVRIDLVPRWRGGDLDRLINAAHSAVHEAFARWLPRHYPEWTQAPEVTFAVFAERGVIDILAWHAPTRTLLVIELKTALVDLNDLVSTADRKRRLARVVAKERGWNPLHVGVWVVVAANRTNRRHLDAHAAFLRNAFPADGRAMRRWLAAPSGSIAAISLETLGVGRRAAPNRGRVRVAAP